MRSDNTRLNDQCRIAVSRGGRTRDLLDSFSKDNRTRRESTCKLRAQYDPKFADHCYDGRVAAALEQCQYLR